MAWLRRSGGRGDGYRFCTARRKQWSRCAWPHHKLGPTGLGTDGGTVQSADGAMVSFGPGVLEQRHTVSIETMTEADLPIRRSRFPDIWCRV